MVSQTDRAKLKRLQRAKLKKHGLAWLQKNGRSDFKGRKATGIILEIQKVSGHKFPPIPGRYEHVLDFVLKGIKPSPQPVKPRLKKSAPGFYQSKDWMSVRYKALKANDGRCELCGSSKHDGAQLHVDHILPRSKFPALELELTNLQVLCRECNLGKSNKDKTDWRLRA